MAFNKIGAPGYATTSQPMAVALAPGQTFLIPAGQSLNGTYGGNAQNQTGWTLSGQYLVETGPYTTLQMYNPLLQIWENLDTSTSTPAVISGDGTNYRLANLTGCPVGGIITTVGSGMANGFNTVTVTPSAGGSTWNTLVGGAINSTVTVTTAGTGYTRLPTLVFNPPVAQGSTPYVLPTAVVSSLSAGGIGGVTVTNQGAGLVAAPTITVIPHPLDTTAGGAVLTVNSTLAGSGTLTWIAQATPGTVQTSVPTLSFTGTISVSPVVTAIMDFAITGLTITAAGVAYTSGITFSYVIGGSQVAGTAGYTNPEWDKGMILPRPAQVTVATTTTTFTSSTVTVVDAGCGFQAVPPAIYPSYIGATTQAVLTPTVGGVNDVSTFFSL